MRTQLVERFSILVDEMLDELKNTCTDIRAEAPTEEVVYDMYYETRHLMKEVEQYKQFLNTTPYGGYSRAAS